MVFSMWVILNETPIKKFQNKVSIDRIFSLQKCKSDGSCSKKIAEFKFLVGNDCPVKRCFKAMKKTLRPLPDVRTWNHVLVSVDLKKHKARIKIDGRTCHRERLSRNLDNLNKTVIIIGNVPWYKRDSCGKTYFHVLHLWGGSPWGGLSIANIRIAGILSEEGYAFSQEWVYGE
jgi:hypothetical protein